MDQEIITYVEEDEPVKLYSFVPESNGTYSVSEMMEKLQLNNRRYFTKEYLKIAVMEVVVEPLYPDKPKHPRQKYRLTEKGKALLK